VDIYPGLYRTIGHLVRAARKELHLTQDDLARRIGLTRTSINNIEQGKQRIQIHMLYSIADALNVAPTALLPPVGAPSREAIDTLLPSDLEPQERAWVRTVLATSAEERDRT
jgi:y4mF family transcriptional regulator